MPVPGGAASGKAHYVSALGSQGGESWSIDLPWPPPSFPEFVD